MEYKGYIINEAVTEVAQLGVGDWVILHGRYRMLKCVVKRVTKLHIVVVDADGGEHKFNKFGREVGNNTDEFSRSSIVPLSMKEVDTFRKSLWKNKVIAKLDMLKGANFSNLSGDRLQAIHKILEGIDLAPER